MGKEFEGQAAQSVSAEVKIFRELLEMKIKFDIFEGNEVD